VKSDPEKARRVLTDCANIVKIVTLLMKPILPEFARKIEEQLNIPPLVWSDLDKGLINHKIGKSQIVLRKIEPIVLKKKAETQTPSKPTKNPSVINLKVATVIDVRDHPEAEKLYILKIDLGVEQRQICAGLKPFYPKKIDLIGKHLVVVTNMKPANLRGELSQGMLMAADDGKNVGILTANKSPPGTQVIVEDIKEYSTNEITIQEFQIYNLEAKAGKAYAEGGLLRTPYEVVAVEKVSEGKIR
jgi:methionyl-tRNA synthetase